MGRPSAKKHRNRPVFEGGKIQLSQGKMGRIANEGEWPRNSRDVNMQ